MHNKQGSTSATHLISINSVKTEKKVPVINVVTFQTFKVQIRQSMLNTCQKFISYTVMSNFLQSLFL